MDEAFVEAIVVERGMQVRYAPDAVVYNTGPTTISDFVKQRRRNHAGHLYLKHKYGYAVSIQNKRVFKVAFKELWGIIQLLWVLFLLAVLEGWSASWAEYDFAIKVTVRGVGHGLEPEAERAECACAEWWGAERERL
ncbi:MAG: glycosyltransferase family 2 protein [Caldilineaceae bacterium]